MKPYKRMTKRVRDKIEVLYNSHHKPKQIAEILGYHIASIYSELKRGFYDHKNTDWTYTRKYSADKAQRKADFENTAKGAPLKIGKDHNLAKYIEEKILIEKKSPEAVLGEIKRDNITFNTTICKTTLYSYIDKGLFLHISNKNLLHKGKKRKHYKKIHTQKKIQKGRSIEERPAIINDNKEFGHWEYDTVIGQKKKDNVIFVFTERKTNFEIMLKARDKSSLSCIQCMNKLERKYGKKFSKVFKSITCDNGTEFSDYISMEKSIYSKNRKRTTVYYCHPYSSWERGRNENNNAFIRRFIPKGEKISNFTDEYISRVEDYINDYPRKLYNFNSSRMQFLLEMQNL